MQRRDFLLQSCRTCAALIALPAIASLEGCSGAKALSYEPAAGSSILEVPITVFGSGNSVVIATKALPDRLWLTKDAGGNHHALLLKCTHKGGPLSEENGTMVCAWHSSRFNNEGTPTGGPARTALKSYPVNVEGDNLKIDLA